MELQSKEENVAHSLNVECSYDPPDSQILIHVKSAADVSLHQFAEGPNLACSLKASLPIAFSLVVIKVLCQMNEGAPSYVVEARHRVKDDIEGEVVVAEWSTAAKAFVLLRPVVYFEAVSCRAFQDVELRRVPRRRAETHISDPAGRSLCTVRQGNFDSLNTVSSVRNASVKQTFLRRQ